MSKTCNKCGQVKPETAFYSGLGHCIECHKAYYREYWQRPEIKARRLVENMTPEALARKRGYGSFSQRERRKKL